MTTWTEDDKAAARRYYETEGAAAAARATGIPVGTITSWARRRGWSQSEAAQEGRQRMAAAVQAAKLVNEQGRQELAGRLLGEVHKLVDQLQRPTTYLEVINTAGKPVLDPDDPEGPPPAYVVAELTVPHPKPADQKHIAVAAAVLIDKLQLLSGAATERRETAPQQDALTAELDTPIPSNRQSVVLSAKAFAGDPDAALAYAKSVLAEEALGVDSRSVKSILADAERVLAETRGPAGKRVDALLADALSEKGPNRTARDRGAVVLWPAGLPDLPAAALCTDRLPARHDGCGGAWAVRRGHQVDDGLTAGTARCSYCRATRTLLLPAGGHPLAGPLTPPEDGP